VLALEGSKYLLEPTNLQIGASQRANTVGRWRPWTVVVVAVAMSQFQTWKGWPTAGRTDLLAEGRAEPLAAGWAEPSAMGTSEAPVQ
jgi:hypothetical protein